MAAAFPGCNHCGMLPASDGNLHPFFRETSSCTAGCKKGALFFDILLFNGIFVHTHESENF